GDRVQINQQLLEIETAKSLVELPSPYAGVVTALLVEPGTTVEVGTPIITIDTDPGGPAAPDGGVTDAADGVEASPAGEPGPTEGADQAPAQDAGEGSGAVLVGYG